jgi:hypothetical protein
VFILIGSDGKEYGPATADQVKQWIADGRATLDTLAKRVGEGAWRRLMDFSEFQRTAPISDMPPPKLPEARAATSLTVAPNPGAGMPAAGSEPLSGPGAAGTQGGGAGPGTAGAMATASAAGTPGANGGDLGGGAAAAPDGASRVSHGVAPAAAPMVVPVDPRTYAAELIGRAEKLRIGACVGRAWRLTTGNFWAIVGGTFLSLVVLMVVQFIPILGAIAGLFLSGVIYGGLYLYYLKFVRGESPDLGVIFSGFSGAFVPLMLGSLVSSLLTTLGLILLILPGIYLAISYTFTFLLIQDRKLDFWCAMEVSRRVITAQWWRVFGLMIVAGFLACLGIIALFIGIFVTLPILFGAIVYAYEDLVNPPAAPSAPALPSAAPGVAT